MEAAFRLLVLCRVCEWESQVTHPGMEGSPTGSLALKDLIHLGFKDFLCFYCDFSRNFISDYKNNLYSLFFKWADKEKVKGEN